MELDKQPQYNDESTIDLRKLLAIFGEKKFIVLAIIAVCTVIAVIVAFVLPKSYQSSSLVRIKSNSSAMSGYSALAGSLGIDVGGNSKGSPESYIELMKSREVLDPIISELDLPEESKAKMTADGFAKDYLEITNTKKTDLIVISAYGKTPEEAQNISKSVVDNFLALMTKLNKEDNSTSLQFLKGRIDIAKGEMEDAEDKLQAYQQEKGVFSPDDQSKLLIEQLGSYDQSIAQLTASIEADSAKLENVTGQLNEQNVSLSNANVSESDSIQNLRNSIVNKRVELVGLQQRYTEEHPDVIRAKKELEALNQSLSNEINNALASNSVALSSAQGGLIASKITAETALAVDNASLDAIKAKQAEVEENIKTLSADGVEYVRLARQQAITQDVYTNLVKAYENTRIQETKESMDIQVVDEANLPKEDMPVKPKKKLIAAIGFVVGLMGAFGYSLYVYNKRYGL